MAPLAREFYNLKEFEEDKEWLKTKLEIDVEGDIFKTNLEVFLSTLHSLSYYNDKRIKPLVVDAKKESQIEEVVVKEMPEDERINNIIKNARNFLLRKILNEDNVTNRSDIPLLNIYKQFYRKLLSRNSTLPRLNIFTTNYDLYSEKAMDLLGIHYVNGFTGGISKFFNPTIFNYALAEKMDLSQSKWSVIDNFFSLVAK
ncbi:MAG: hypothetical protein PHP79_09580 [Clostridia bacterium]|nr:hypothetical protein [Clostridia bacterium]